MLRHSRSLMSLVRALMLPVATVSGGLAVATTLIACKDESQPEYWVEKLDDRAWRPRAIKRLEQFFEDAYTKANKDLNSEEVKQLADKILEPLVKTYVDNYGDLDDKTRESLIKLIASFRDKRAEPALKVAFDEFAKTGRGADDLRWASRAYADMKIDALGDSIIQAFDKLKAAKAGASAYRDLNEAMLKNPQKSWGGLLKAKLQPEISRPDDKDPSTLEKYRNELFWQTTAAQLLGEIQDPAAVEPLLKIMLDPQKADVQATAALALVKIGPPAVQRAIKILKDEDEAMATYAISRIQAATGSKEVPKDKPHVAVAAIVLGVIGRPEATAPMVEVLGSTNDEATKAVVARELAKLPATPASKQAFKEAYESISADTMIPPGSNALQELTESAATFYDPDFVPWLIARAQKAGGSSDQQSLLQSTATVSAIKLMKPDQTGMVNVAVRRWGTDIEKDAFKRASELVKACGDRVSCYLAALEKSENQEKANQITGIKAAYMIGIYGDDKARAGIIERLDSIDNAAVRFSSAQTIDHLSPKGSKEAADELQKIIDDNAKSADKSKAAGDAPLKQVMYRIRSRAQ